MKGLRQALQSGARQCLTGRFSQRACSTQQLYSLLRPTMLQKVDLFTWKSRAARGRLNIQYDTRKAHLATVTIQRISYSRRIGNDYLRTSAESNSFTRPNVAASIQRGDRISWLRSWKDSLRSQTARMAEICVYGEPHTSIKVQPQSHL